MVEVFCQHGLMKFDVYFFAMSRLPRFIVPGHAHLVTQRGYQGKPTFFDEADYALYLELLASMAKRSRLDIWSYCLMPNHVHLIAIPNDEGSLARTFSRVHRAYTCHVNKRTQKSGRLWQGRFGSVAMDEAHLINAIRYVALNPVRAGLTERAEDWPWSSTRALLAGQNSAASLATPVLQRTGDFADFLNESFDESAAYSALRKAETIGRPVGSPCWIAELEAQSGRKLAVAKRGRKPALVDEKVSQQSC